MKVCVKSYQDVEVYYAFECAGFEWKFSGKRYTVQGYRCEYHSGQHRNLLRNVSSSRYKFNAERRLRFNRMQLQQQCACVRVQRRV